MKMLAAVLALLTSTFVYAHSGGTDSNGCHTSSRTGHYHCH